MVDCDVVVRGRWSNHVEMDRGVRGVGGVYGAE
jgi:hypothetical protein